MGLITAEPLHTMGKKLKFKTDIATLGAPQVRSANNGEKKAKGSARGSHKGDMAHSGMVFHKGHGQHILKNPLVINAIIEKAGIKPTDIVLEIGPGTGNLTEKLLVVAKKVIAFEIDPRMVAELNKRFQQSPLQHKLEVIKGNCLDYDFPYFDKCVANVPYSISSAIVFKLLRHPTSFKCAVLMFQREFAMRICAQPGSDAYCRLSVNCQLLAKCSHLMKISKNSFSPPPKVESSVIRLDPKHPPPPVDFEEWDGIVKMIFNRKNKKVSSIFRTKVAQLKLYDQYVSYYTMLHGGENKSGGSCMSLAGFKDMLESFLSTEELMSRRGKSLDLEDIGVLLAKFNSHGVHFV